MAAILLSCMAMQIADDAMSSDDYIRILKNAQRSNISKYQNGKIVAHLASGQIGEIALHDYAICNIEWSGRKSWAAITRWDGHDHVVTPDSKTGVEEQWIVDGVKITMYHPKGKRVVISPMTEYEAPLVSQLTPSRCWYGPLDLIGMTWYDVLNLNNSINADPSRFTISAKPLTDDLIEVRREDIITRGYFIMVCSLSMEGNVVEYEIGEPMSDYLARGTCEWKRDGEGRVYMARHRMESEDTKTKIVKYKDCRIDSIDLGHSPRAERFTLASLNLPRDVTVNDELTGRNWRVGDATVESVLDRLELLIEEMQSRGFATDRSSY
ncbi:hypothetical protein [Tautonia sociabilis]|uniref:Uncharacterized protein n=1 Tax=Tautonia sociabilis TaxID=2080755 RepID=A0A432MKN8_9BACT|nr:hypothetical protein [Tautonia sociabilis]RUL87777.1 hypothetical protein TsocGM_10465 [Tautonia sociabilis]